MKPVCLVTGAGGRLGTALSTALAEDYNIIAVYRNSTPKLSSQLVRRIHPLSKADSSVGANNDIFCIQADITNLQDIRRIVEVALARFGRVDVLINSAADTKFHGKVIDLFQAENYPQSQLLTNSIAPMLLASAFFQQIWKNAPGDNARFNRNIINVSSVSGLWANVDSGQAFYSASKAALNMLTLYLSLELAPYSIRANAICPGKFTTVESTNLVVNEIKKIIEGDMTGEIISGVS